jgi:hypothetical protein
MLVVLLLLPLSLSMYDNDFGMVVVVEVVAASGMAVANQSPVPPGACSTVLFNLADRPRKKYY